MPLETMLSNESESATWKRYEKLAFETLWAVLLIAARVGLTPILVASNNGVTATGAVTFRFEPSALRAEDDSPTALGETGDGALSLHAIATAAHTTTTAHFN